MSRDYGLTPFLFRERSCRCRLKAAFQMHSERCLQAAAAACVRADATSACLRSTFATRVYAARRRVEAVARALDQACHAAFAGRLCVLRRRGKGRRKGVIKGPRFL